MTNESTTPVDDAAEFMAEFDEEVARVVPAQQAIEDGVARICDIAVTVAEKFEGHVEVLEDIQDEKEKLGDEIINLKNNIDRVERELEAREKLSGNFNKRTSS